MRAKRKKASKEESILKQIVKIGSRAFTVTKKKNIMRAFLVYQTFEETFPVIFSLSLSLETHTLSLISL